MHGIRIVQKAWGKMETLQLFSILFLDIVRCNNSCDCSIGTAEAYVTSVGVIYITIGTPLFQYSNCVSDCSVQCANNRTRNETSVHCDKD